MQELEKFLTDYPAIAAMKYEYVMLENFPTQRAALAEYQRLVKLQIADARLKLDKK